MGTAMRESFRRHLERWFSLTRLLSDFFDTTPLGAYEKETFMNDARLRQSIISTINER